MLAVVVVLAWGVAGAALAIASLGYIGWKRRDPELVPDEPHSHVFNSDIGHTMRPSTLHCKCGAVLVRDPVTELWSVR